MRVGAAPVRAIRHSSRNASFPLTAGEARSKRSAGSLQVRAGAAPTRLRHDPALRRSRRGRVLRSDRVVTPRRALRDAREGRASFRKPGGAGGISVGKMGVGRTIDFVFATPGKRV